MGQPNVANVGRMILVLTLVMDKVFLRSVPLGVQNVTDMAIVTALLRLVAEIAIFPLKWQADVRERGAELTFYVGGRLGWCR